MGALVLTPRPEPLSFAVSFRRGVLPHLRPAAMEQALGEPNL